ncbi:metallophosphoesterase [Solicola sp. PLA-1-18]|uniref:metallophosphoesterase n=1 Tax=Solicola sp. PLA-1-18 TaxID=3380532 RepID=UPI003B78C6C0
MKHPLRAVVVGLLAAAVPAALVAAPSQAVRPRVHPDRVVLSPTAAPATSQTFTWRTSARAGRVVVAGPGGTRSVRSTKTRRIGSARHLSVTVTGLRAGTAYRYKVGSRRGWSPVRTFTTARADAAPYSFVVLGDAQKSIRSSLTAVTRRAFADEPRARFVLQLGDLVNTPSSDAQWDQAFDALGPRVSRVPLVAVAGNHEYRADRTAKAHRAHTEGARNGVKGQGSTWYWTDYQGVRVIVLDGNRKLKEQTAFLDLAARTNPSRWTVVAFHQPVYAGRGDRVDPSVRRAWGPILERRDVDLVLTGHDHVYTRGYVRPDGPQYVTMNSGPKYYPLAPASANDFTRNGAVRKVAADRTSTYGTVTVSGSTLTFRAVVSAKGKGSTTSRGVGQVLDEVRITDDGHAKQVR